jgi:malate/lactate dehydrogenase
MIQRRFTFRTRLNAFKGDTVTLLPSENMPEDKIKKQARIIVSERHASTTVGFMHAVLLAIGDEHFLLAGPSGVGKSTLAESIVTSIGARIVANDWVAVEREADGFYASDLNYKKSIIHADRCRLGGVIFVTKTDELMRDAYVPDDKEFNRHVRDLFDGVPTTTVQTLSRFWIKNRRNLPFYCVLPARNKNIAYVTQSLIMILQRLRPKDTPLQVGIVGIGAVGVALANELGKQPLIQKVHLYNRSKQAVSGLSIDLNQALYQGKSDIYVAHDSVEDLFRRSSVVFLAFRETNSVQPETGMPERWKRVRPHTEMVKHYAAIAAKVGYTGTVFMITNPVDFLTYVYLQSSQEVVGTAQRTFQAYGIGLEGDVARAIFYGRHYAPQLTSPDVTMYGSHADDLSLSIALPLKQLADLTDSVMGASSEVRSHDIRTVFGPVAATMRSFNAFLESGSAHVSLVQQNVYIGRKVTFKFGLPMLDTISKNHAAAYQTLVQGNIDKLAKFKGIL